MATSYPTSTAPSVSITTCNMIIIVSARKVNDLRRVSRKREREGRKGERGKGKYKQTNKRTYKQANK